MDEVILIDDAWWDRLADLTGGTSALCYQCGACTATCPWGLVSPHTLSVRSLVRRAQLGLLVGDGDLWRCSTCARCEESCPRGVHITDVFRGLRAVAWEQRAIPAGLPSLLWSVYWNGNPWSQPPSQRSAWAKGLDVPRFDAAQHEVLLYVGCTASYDRRAQQIARSLIRVLNAAGVRFGTLSDEEPCCGEAVLSLGHRPYFEEIAGQTAAVFQAEGVTQVVTISPHCYDVFRNHYPRSEAGFRPLHYTQYLATLIEQGRLAFDQALEARIAFHDPCYLARHNDEVEAPRLVLASISGVEVVEMASTGAETVCCGGGGGRMWMETPPGERFSDLRVREALATGASILATACPFCVACLEDSVKAQRTPGLIVRDVAEIAALALSA